MPYLDRSGVAIHYEKYGESSDRTPLFLTHGYAASCEMWHPNVAALSAHRQVVVWDIRGHGHSASPPGLDQYSEALAVGDMVAVLDACGVDRAAVGGLSLGGYLSLAFNLVHPDRVAALLLFDTGPGFRRDDARAEWNDMVERMAAAFEREGLDALAASPEVEVAPHDPAGLALAGRGILAQRDARVIESLAAVDVPTLSLVGADDKQFLNAAEYIASKVPGATKVVLDDAGHAANIDQPDAFNRAVADFLDRVDGTM